MKTIGLIGGLGPEATVDYYNRIIDAFKNENNDLNYPEIIICSLNLSKLLLYMRMRHYDSAIDYIVAGIETLERSGAEFAAISANTPHMFFSRIQERSRLPLISIVETTCRECLARGFKKPALFGTGFTMKGSFYQEVFGNNGLDIIIPGKEDIDKMDKKLFTEIELGIFKDETRDYLIDVMERMKEKKYIDSVILGCTEFPLILTGPEYAGLPMLNTTQLHVDAIVSYCNK
jgi:aspartate racemase